MACIATASLLLAASRAVHDEAARTGDKKMFGDSVRLESEMRQQMLVAHELCAKEAIAMAKRKAAGANEPWIDPSASVSLVGKRGNPRKPGKGIRGKR
jgi:hypothetical protein